MNATNIQANQNATNNQANMNATNIQANMSATNNQANMNATNIQAIQNTTNIQANHKPEEISRGREDDNDSIQDKESNQSSKDEDIGNLTNNDIATVHEAMVAGTTNSMSSPAASMLNKAPRTIEDCFSSVVGDYFHFMDRPKSQCIMMERRDILLL